MTVDILILGAGWTSAFLTELCDERGVTHAATTRSGRASTIKFTFDPDSDDIGPYSILPNAEVVLVTFPITQKGASERIVRLYTESHKQEGLKTKFIQLGATSIWDGPRLAGKVDVPLQAVQHKWYDRHAPYVSTPRGDAEGELLALSPTFPTTVLNLAGLWGGARQPKNWVARVAPTKEALRNKGSLHVIHGVDIARAILAIRDDFTKAQGQRWIVTDGRVYDWWDLASAWGSAPPAKPTTISLSIEYSSAPDPQRQKHEDDRGPQPTWVRELLQETGVRGLPRDVRYLGRALDSREFWDTFGITPLMTLFR
ncbi:hypothetical protein CPB84DRAFT_1672646 [Gymnopilus junonius]|uniref:Uncharacterized protein n=1 Tax=Gymnopilus junonius TaxID=109634 RepID=A0A9P5TSZ8_GYMJU|nr:hypothetical protein CPB84DRAFT_1672646 [Gymnopilus junonius]